MNASQNIGKTLKAYRKAKGLTQAQLAERTARSTDAISQIERGLNIPSLETLLAVAEALNVPLGIIMDTVQNRWSQKRNELFATAVASLSALSDEQLSIVIKQIKAFR